MSLVSVKFSDDSAPTVIETSPNEIASDGAFGTTTDADALAPDPPSSEITGPVELSCWPPAVALTFTVTVQFWLGPMIAPESLIVCAPGSAITEALKHVLLCPLGVSTTSPARRSASRT